MPGTYLLIYCVFVQLLIQYMSCLICVCVEFFIKVGLNVDIKGYLRYKTTLCHKVALDV